MENQQCKNCKYFRQHYGLDERGLFRLYCGHCTRSRPRNRRPNQNACIEFIPGENIEKAFVNKAYLSKTLLDWIMQLDLLPKIKEETEL